MVPETDSVRSASPVTSKLVSDAREIDRHALPTYQVRYVPSTDRYGLYYDASGNVRDRNGDLVRVAPLTYR